MLSALVMPGLGQLAQRRWAAAAFYGSGFLAAFLLVLFFAGHILVAYYSFGLALNTQAEPPRMTRDMAGVAISFGVAVIFYLAGLIDTWGACRKSVSRWFDARSQRASAGINGTSSEGSSQGG